MGAAAHNQRRAMMAKIEIGKKQLGLDETTYRDMLSMLTGQTSRRDCTDAQLAAVIRHLAANGAVFIAKKPRPATKAPASRRRGDWYEVPDDVPHAAQKRLICALWRDLGYDLRSLDTRMARQAKVDSIIWCHDQALLHTLITDLQARLAAKKRKETKNAPTGQ